MDRDRCLDILKDENEALEAEMDEMNKEGEANGFISTLIRDGIAGKEKEVKKLRERNSRMKKDLEK